MSVYTQQRFIFMTLDPVHIGTGGYRLGRVDMSIVREPGTNLPKIPGTSLAGAIRSYAHLHYFDKPESGKRDKALDDDTKSDSLDEAKKRKEREAFYYTFGSATDAGGGQAGTVSIGDARLLFFPVASQAGPVWVTTAEILQEVWGMNSFTLPKDKAENSVEPKDNGPLVTTLDKTQLNLGWLLFEAKSGLKITPQNDIAQEPQNHITQKPEWKAIQGRIVLTTARNFTQIVNSNLEVRTSVSIDPETGAADDGALFTYEALPRATWLWCDIIEDDYRGKFKAAAQNIPVSEGKSKPERPLDVVRAGLDLIEYLGVGGMGTRGFGRMKIMSFVEDKGNQSSGVQAKAEEQTNEPK